MDRGRRARPAAVPRGPRSWSGPGAVGEARPTACRRTAPGTRSTTCGRSTWPRSAAAVQARVGRGQPAARHAGRAPVDGAVRRPGGRARRAARRAGAARSRRRPGRVGRGDVDARGGRRVRWSSTSAAARSTPSPPPTRRRRRRGRGPAHRVGGGPHRHHVGRGGVGQARSGVPRRGAAGAARRGRHPRLPGPARPDRGHRPAGRAGPGRTAAVLARPWRRGSGARCASGSRSSWSAATSPGRCARWGRTPRSVVVVGGLAGDDEILAAVAGALPPGTAVGRGDVAGDARPPLRRRLRPGRSSTRPGSQAGTMESVWHSDSTASG